MHIVRTYNRNMVIKYLWITIIVSGIFAVASKLVRFTNDCIIQYKINLFLINTLLEYLIKQ